MRLTWISTWLTAASSLLSTTTAIDINVSDHNSVEHAAAIAGTNMLTFYNGTTPGYAPGILTNPFYWWEAGAMFGIMIHFWHLTGNDSWNQLVMDGLLWQRGDGNDFEPTNQTKDLGNDDQSFWAYAALDAAEFAFPNPPPNMPSWLSLAQAVFNRQIARWDPFTCGGGIRWQIYQFNPGWTYKNTAANGGLFHIAARLARYTGNTTYADNANKIWDWMVGVNFIQTRGTPNTTNSSLYVIDGAPTTDNCTGPNTDGISWTYNHGTILMGAAYMYNYTNGSDLWHNRLQLLMVGAQNFFVKEDNDDPSTGKFPATNGTILSEVACEFPSPQTCKVDQPAFKSTLIRWLAVTTQLAPWTADAVYPWLNASAQHAAKQCSGSAPNKDTNNPHPGGSAGTWCGRRWYSSTFDGYSSLGEQMSAMSSFQNVLIRNSTPPYTTVTGGNSTSDPDAGNAPTHPTILSYIYKSDVSRGDVAGAWVLTVLGFFIIGGGAIWMVREEPEDSWAGRGPNAGWTMPSSAGDMGNYYKRTYGYGAYRLAGLQAGGVYGAKNSSARRAFAKPNMPALGLGSGGWWFGSGRGAGENWWDKRGEEHADERGEKMDPIVTTTSASHNPHDSLGSYDSGKKFFSRFGSAVGAGSGSSSNNSTADKPSGTRSAIASKATSITKAAKTAMPINKKAKKGEKDGEWVSLGKGVFVRARDEPVADSSTGTSTPSNAPVERPAAAARKPSNRQSAVSVASSAQPSRMTSARQSRAASVARGRTLHWAPAEPEPEIESESEHEDEEHGGSEKRK